MSEGGGSWMSQLKRRASSPFIYLFALLRPSVGGMVPTYSGEVIFFPRLLIQVLISSRDTLTVTQKYCFAGYMGIP